jgi:uncharacterized protein (DUF1330 family)
MEYVRRIPALIEKHSGQYLVQGVEPTIVEGAVAESFLEERQASDLHGVWSRTTTSRIPLVDGCT